MIFFAAVSRVIASKVLEEAASVVSLPSRDFLVGGLLDFGTEGRF